MNAAWRKAQSSFHAKKIDKSIAPGGWTKYMQDLNVSWNKPIRALAMEKYDKWPAEEGITQETPAGYLKPLPRRVIVN